MKRRRELNRHASTGNCAYGRQEILVARQAARNRAAGGSARWGTAWLCHFGARAVVFATFQRQGVAMRKGWVLTVALCAMVTLAVGAVVAEPFEDGRGAYARGDFGTALRLWLPLAERGDVRAQFGVGVMHEKGQGVVQDNVDALKWYRLAAAQGDAAAQYNLGVMYTKGQGVLQDYVRAHMWFNLAAVSGSAEAVKNRDIVAVKMTPQQVADAQKLARECQARQFKGCESYVAETPRKIRPAAPPKSARTRAH